MTHRLHRLTALMLAVIMTFSMLLVPVEATSPFGDVSSDAWYKDAVDYVYGKGWMKGVGDTQFAPKAEVSRAMFVTVLARYAGTPEIDKNDETVFSDVDVGVYYTGAVAWAARNGIVKGVDETHFAPDRSISRQEMCTMLYRFLQMQGLTVEPDGDEPAFADATNVSNFAQEAVRYCAYTGLIVGFNDGSFRPAETSNRAQLATVLKRMDLMISGPRPAQTFEFEADDGMTVSIDAPEGALPEGSAMQISRVEDEKTLYNLSMKSKGELLYAADISFSKDGVEIEPDEKVEVRVKLEGMEDVQSISVLHIRDNGAVEYVDSEVIATRSSSDKYLRFYAQDFSVYAFFEGSGVGADGLFTVRFHALAESGAAGSSANDADWKLINTQKVRLGAYADWQQLVNANANAAYSQEVLSSMPVYDPGVPDIGAMQSFEGWALNNKTFDVSFKGDTTYSLNLWFAENAVAGGEYDVYSVVYNVYKINFYDQEMNLISTQTARVFDNAASIVIEQSYSPYVDGQYFRKWVSLAHDNVVKTGLKPEYRQNIDENDFYELGVEYSRLLSEINSADNTLKLYPYIERGSWIVFEANLAANNLANGFEDPTAANYLPSQFVSISKTIRNALGGIPTMTRPGYTFQGWYTVADMYPGTEFDKWDEPLAANLTLYAKWEPATTQIRVVYYSQVATDNVGDYNPDPEQDQAHYLFYKPQTLPEIYEIPTGTPITPEFLNGKGCHQLAGTTTSEMGYYFQFGRYEIETPYALGDGSALALAYYTRKTITIRTHQYADILANIEWFDRNQAYYRIDIDYFSAPLSGAYTSDEGDTILLLRYVNGNTVDSDLSSHATLDANGHPVIPASNAAFYMKNGTRHQGSVYVVNNPNVYERQGLYGAPLMGGIGQEDPGCVWALVDRELSSGSHWVFESEWSIFSAQHGVTRLSTDYYSLTYTKGNNHKIITLSEGLDGSFARNALRADETFGSETVMHSGGELGGYRLRWYRQAANEAVTPNSTAGATKVLVDPALPSTQLLITSGTGYTNYENRIQVSAAAPIVYEFWERNRHTLSYVSEGVTLPAISAMGAEGVLRWSDASADHSTEENRLRGIPYGESLVNFANYPGLDENTVKDGKRFMGWYADPGFSRPFDFSMEMPDDDLMVFAKWVPVRYRVVIDFNSQGIQGKPVVPPGQDSTLILQYGELLGSDGLNRVTLENCILQGYYLDPEFKVPFDLSMGASEELCVSEENKTYGLQRPGETYAHYCDRMRGLDPSEAHWYTDPYTKRYSNDRWDPDSKESYGDYDVRNAGTVYRITIYAKWRQNPEYFKGIRVMYLGDNDPDQGFFQTSGQVEQPHTHLDGNLYVDQAQAFAMTASVPEGEPNQRNEDMKFLYWEILNPEKKVVSYVYPGQTFTVELANAVKSASPVADPNCPHPDDQLREYLLTYPATCTTNGVREGALLCQNCGAVVDPDDHTKQATVPAYKHAWDSETTEAAPVTQNRTLLGVGGVEREHLGYADFGAAKARYVLTCQREVNGSPCGATLTKTLSLQLRVLRIDEKAAVGKDINKHWGVFCHPAQTDFNIPAWNDESVNIRNVDSNDIFELPVEYVPVNYYAVPGGQLYNAPESAYYAIGTVFTANGENRVSTIFKPYFDRYGRLAPAGNTFEGWVERSVSDTQNPGQIHKSTDSTFTLNGPMTLYALFSYTAQSGVKLYTTQPVARTTSNALPDAPAEAMSAGAAEQQGDASRAPSSYTLCFYAQNQTTLLAEGSFAAGESVAVLAENARANLSVPDGYTFVGWRLLHEDYAAGELIDFTNWTTNENDATSNGAISFYACFRKEKEDYNVTWVEYTLPNVIPGLDYLIGFPNAEEGGIYFLRSESPARTKGDSYFAQNPDFVAEMGLGTATTVTNYFDALSDFMDGTFQNGLLSPVDFVSDAQPGAYYNNQLKQINADVDMSYYMWNFVDADNGYYIQSKADLSVYFTFDFNDACFAAAPMKKAAVNKLFGGPTVFTYDELGLKAPNMPLFLSYVKTFGSTYYTNERSGLKLYVRSDVDLNKAVVTYQPNYPVAVEHPASPNRMEVQAGVALDVWDATDVFYCDGYYLTGWNTMPDGSGANRIRNGQLTLAAGENLTLYAQWTAGETLNGARRWVRLQQPTPAEGTDEYLIAYKIGEEYYVLVNYNPMAANPYYVEGQSYGGEQITAAYLAKANYDPATDSIIGVYGCTQGDIGKCVWTIKQTTSDRWPISVKLDGTESELGYANGGVLLGEKNKFFWSYDAEKHQLYAPTVGDTTRNYLAALTRVFDFANLQPNPTANYKTFYGGYVEVNGSATAANPEVSEVYFFKLSNQSDWRISFRDEKGNMLHNPKFVSNGERVQGELIPYEELPKRDGYYFHFWRDALTGEPFDVNQPITRDVNLVAVWIPSVEYEYTVYLRAVYGMVNKEGKSHFYWYSNNGSALNNGAGDRYVSYKLDGAGNRVEDFDLYETTGIPYPVTGTGAEVVFENEDGSTGLSYKGNRFLGWAKCSVVGSGETGVAHPELGEDDLFLKWDPTLNGGTGGFLAKDSSGAWKPVHEVYSDGLPYEDFYAVWMPEYFWIFHSSDGSVDQINAWDEVNDCPLQSFDITAFVKGNHYFGGYYKDYGGVNSEMVYANLPLTSAANASTAGGTVNATADFSGSAFSFTAYTGETETGSVGTSRFWMVANAYKTTKKMTAAEAAAINGKTMRPQAGTVYYLKEVPLRFMENQLVYTQHTDAPNALEKVFFLSVTDDTLYKQIGFSVLHDAALRLDVHEAELLPAMMQNEERHLSAVAARKFTLQQYSDDSQIKKTISVMPKDMFEKKYPSENYQGGYVTVLQYNDCLTEENLQTFTNVLPYWTTYDGVKVFGSHAMVLQLDSNEVLDAQSFDLAKDPNR